MEAMMIPMLIASTAMSAVGAIQQGSAQAAAMNQQADAMRRNALMADLQERQAYDAGLQNELSQRRNNSRQMGAVRAAVGESGFEAASGSALAVQQQSAQDLEMEALSQRYGSLIQGYGHADQARMDRFQEAGMRKSARNAKRSGFMGAATSILSGVGNYYGHQSMLKAIKG